VCGTGIYRFGGNKRGKNVPEKLELFVQNFYPGLTLVTFVNSIDNILEAEDLQRKYSVKDQFRIKAIWGMKVENIPPNLNCLF